MPAGYVKVVHGVAVEIAISHHAGVRVHVQRKRDAALLRIAARLQAYLHQGFAYRRSVAETRQVLDGIDSRHAGRAQEAISDSTG